MISSYMATSIVTNIISMTAPTEAELLEKIKKSGGRIIWDRLEHIEEYGYDYWFCVLEKTQNVSQKH